MIDVRKPTRLWHLTGKKHFAHLIKERHDAVTHPHTAKPREDLLTLIAATLCGVIGIGYTFGKYSYLFEDPPKETCAETETKTKCPPKDPKAGQPYPRCPSECDPK